MSGTTIVAFDLETYLIGHGRLAPQPVCMSWTEGPELARVQVAVGTEAILEAFDILASYALEGRGRLVAHNAAFDLGVLVQAGGAKVLDLVWRLLDAGAVTCSRIREKLRKIALGRVRFDPDQSWRPKAPYSLDSLTRQYFGMDRSAEKYGPDSWRLRYHELEGIPWENWPRPAQAYVLKDAVDCWRVHRAQAPPGEWFQDEQDPSRWPDEAAQVRAAFALHLTGAWGMAVDPDRVRALEARLHRRVGEAWASLIPPGIVRSDGSKVMEEVQSRVELGWLSQGRKPPVTVKGNIRTHEEALRGSGDPELAKLADIATDRAELAKDVPLLLAGVRFPISTGFDPLKITGRTSSRRPNLQNLGKRRGVRQCFVPRPGRLFAATDYAAAELVAFAQVLLDLVGFSKLAEVLRDGYNPHGMTAAVLTDRTYEEVMDGKKALEQWAKDAYALGKAGNFGIGGGLGAARFREMVVEYGLPPVSLEEAARVLDAVKTRYPEIGHYFRIISRAVDDGGGSTLIIHRGSGRLYDCEGFTNACNARFQALVADGAKAALYAVQKECRTQGVTVPCPTCQGTTAPTCQVCRGRGEVKDPLYGSRPVWFVHDELGLEVPEDPARATAAADRLSEVMRIELAKFVPDLPDAVRTEAVLMDCWHKDAQEVRGSGGLLEPWSPEGWDPLSLDG